MTTTGELINTTIPMDMERSLLSVVLMNPQQVRHIVPKDFGLWLYPLAQAMVAVITEHGVADVPLIAEHAMTLGMDELRATNELWDMLTMAASTTLAPVYAAKIAETAKATREAIALTDAGLARANGEQVDYRALLERLQATQTGGQALVAMSDVEPGAGPKPDLVATYGGNYLLYRGGLHMVAAEPGASKTWLGLHCARAVATSGENVLMVDYEGSAESARSRLDIISASHSALERIHYIRPYGAITPATRSLIARHIEDSQVALAIFDGFAAALTSEGRDENINRDVLEWLEANVTGLLLMGVAVFIVDHVVKMKDGQGRWARGAGAKLGACDASFTLKWKDKQHALSRKNQGIAVLGIGKDRHGALGAEGDVVAEIVYTPHDDGARLEVAFDQPPDTGGYDGPFRPTALMERASKVLEDEGAEGMSLRRLRVAVGGKKEYADLAIETLISEGYVTLAAGSGGAHIHKSNRPFRESVDQWDG